MIDDAFQERLDGIRERIKSACDRSGRSVNDVQLLPISKKFGPEAIEVAARCGLSIFGENRVQEAKGKIPLCSSQLEWHMVGHLQSNKIKEAVRLFSLIHSVDSLKLLERIDRAAETLSAVPVFLEVNVSGEGAKYGMLPDDVRTVLESAQDMARVEVRGLMTMPPFAENPEDARPFFAKLRELREEMCGQGFAINDLSMGMSNDFEVAVEEGSTWIRLGRSLFGGREAYRQ